MEGDGTARAQRGSTVSLRRLAPRALRRRESVEDVFERFYRKHVAEVYQYALALLGNSADAEDVTQQTFLNAYRAFQRGGRPAKPHNWLIKIAHNVCRMRWRQSGRRPKEVPLEEAPEPAALDPEKPVLDEVLSALAHLPFNQRAAIVMREAEDRSYAEIADVLGVTVPAVEALLFRARTTLRAQRKALGGTLGIVPVPASLASFFGGGSGSFVAAGGTALGSELVLKGAAVVATTVLAGGLGYKAVNAVATPERQPTRLPSVGGMARPFFPDSPQSARARRVSRSAEESSFDHAKSSVARHDAFQSAPTNDRLSETGAPAAAPSAQAAPTASKASSSAPAAAATTVGGVAATVPPVVAPAVTVSTPVLTTSVTVPTVTVPTVTLPPPPGLK